MLFRSVVGGGITRTIAVTQGIRMARGVLTLTLDNPGTVTILSGLRQEVHFIAPSTGTYVFESVNRSSNDLDPKAYRYSEGSEPLDDNSAGNYNY